MAHVKKPAHTCPVCKRGFLTEQSVRVHFGHKHSHHPFPWATPSLDKLWELRKAAE